MSWPPTVWWILRCASSALRSTYTAPMIPTAFSSFVSSRSESAISPGRSVFRIRSRSSSTLRPLLLVLLQVGGHGLTVEILLPGSLPGPHDLRPRPGHHPHRVVVADVEAPPNMRVARNLRPLVRRQDLEALVGSVRAEVSLVGVEALGQKARCGYETRTGREGVEAGRLALVLAHVAFSFP